MDSGKPRRAQLRVEVDGAGRLLSNGGPGIQTRKTMGAHITIIVYLRIVIQIGSLPFF